MSVLYVLLLLTTLLCLFNVPAIAQVCSVAFEVNVCQQSSSTMNDCIGTNSCSSTFCSQAYINSIAACYYCAGEGNSTKLLVESCAAQKITVTNPFDDPSFTSSIIAAESTFAASAQRTYAAAQSTPVAAQSTPAAVQGTSVSAMVSGTASTSSTDVVQKSNTTLYSIVAGSIVVLIVFSCIGCCCLSARRRRGKNQPFVLYPVVNQGGYMPATQQVLQVVHTTPVQAPPPTYAAKLTGDSISQAYQPPPPQSYSPPELMAMSTPTPVPTSTYSSGSMNIPVPSPSPLLSPTLPPYPGLKPTEITEYSLDDVISHAPNAYPPLRHPPHTPAPVFANPNAFDVNKPEEIEYKPDNAEDETNKPDEVWISEEGGSRASLLHGGDRVTRSGDSRR